MDSFMFLDKILTNSWKPYSFSNCVLAPSILTKRISTQMYTEYKFTFFTKKKKRKSKEMALMGFSKLHYQSDFIFCSCSSLDHKISLVVWNFDNLMVFIIFIFIYYISMPPVDVIIDTLFFFVFIFIPIPVVMSVSLYFNIGCRIFTNFLKEWNF